ncbi:MAG TPA: protein kinase [Acidobacteriaceae bacterium]|jgi:serine/threonine-protein kinase|nr:protein kinase [Acidobacteriaceae bacterium]
MKRKVIAQYELVKKLGSGGSGIVYLAQDTQLMRPVVLKILQQRELTMEQMRSTVLREARMASAIEHPNVCAIYEVGESSEEAYIVMQYIPGQSLDKLITQGQANLQLVLSVGIQIADGLAAAHRLDIFHRDLKPANVMLTDGGLVKILDFGLARRLQQEEAAAEQKPADAAIDTQPATYTARGGTIAYMAPEQFVTGRSSAQSDIFALGVILYELVSGRHPFHRPDSDELMSIRAIQFADPVPLTEMRPDTPPELTSAIQQCLEKTPAARYAAAADVREALKTIMKALQLETGIIPGEAAANLPTSTPEQERRTTGFLSMLAERFRESSNGQTQQNTMLVLPFLNLGTSEVAPLYGFALADAIAARLARVPSLIVRPSSSLMHVPIQQLDPLAIGEKLLVQYVLAGNFLRSDKGFDLNWQLLDVPSHSVRTGGVINVPTFDLVTVQNEISNEVLSAIEGPGHLKSTAAQDRSLRSRPLGEEPSEEYLQARAVLSSFMARTGSRDDLDKARALFESVVAQDPTFAPGWSGLGITHLQSVRHSFGGQAHLVMARRSFDKALELDPKSAEANLYRVYMLLSRGEKETARHGIEHLLHTTGNDWNVHLMAGIMLRLDGMYNEAMLEFHQALQLSPSNAPVVYNHRARVYHYQNQLELAEEELEKGLMLEPKHPLLRTSLGYQQMRLGKTREAIATLEGVLQDDQDMRMAYPTLALCYLQAGERSKASALIQDEALSAAEADGEMAYRLATYFAVEPDETEALHWLRRAIYLGNENYPWFSMNPAWSALHGHADFLRILEDLKRRFRSNQRTWRRLLVEVRSETGR